MAASASFQLSSLQTQTPPLKKSNFLGQSLNLNLCNTKSTMKSSSTSVTTIAKFNLYEILGGRGLCNGEEGIQKELKKSISEEQQASGSSSAAAAAGSDDDDNQENKESGEFPEDGFEKEMMGFTGGFPGGEKGLKKFIEKNPPPPKKTESSMVSGFNQSVVKKPKPPELPLLLPGMIAIVKNSNNPYYMYCGIVQRITDGKAAVLFEGGNWDRLISFRLEELERREKGPPMVNPRSVILEKMVEKGSEA